ncbi:MAG: VOC family protein [Pseudomonadota bacterium]
MADAPPFHLAFPVDDLVAAEAFYAGVLGCPIGRRDASWIDFDFFGHQIVAHHAATAVDGPTNPVDGEDVPVSHFGVVVDGATFDRLAAKLEGALGPDGFLIPPTLRHEGEPGEQRTFFVRDPAGNALEFKTMRDPDALFSA